MLSIHEKVIIKTLKRNEVIIKRKNSILDLTIRGGIIPHDIKIYIDSDNLYIDNKKYKLSELKTIYIWESHARGGSKYIMSLVIKMKGMVKGASILLDQSSQNLEKVEEFFDYFIFSNEKSLRKLQSDLYIPVLGFSIESDKINQYESTDSITEYLLEILLNNNYKLYKILPKEYLKKYSNKNYLVYESKLLNNSYIEIWETNENIIKRKRKKQIRNGFIASIIIIFCILILIEEYYGSTPINSYDILGMHVFIPLFLGVLIGGLLQYCGIKKALFLTLIISIFGFNLCIFFYDSVFLLYDYSKIMVNNENLSMFEYKYSILKDGIKKETGIGFLTETSYMHVKYKVGEAVYCSFESSTLTGLLTQLEQYEENILIEYYCNSGVIKSIDGIDKNDFSSLRARVEDLRKEDKQKKQEEKERQVREKREREATIHEIMSTAVGKTEEEVERQLKEKGITECTVQYISSKMYDINTVAFARIIEPHIYYVVKDDTKEDMVKIPKIPRNARKDEVIKILQDNGFNYEVENLKGYGESENGILHTITFGGNENDVMLPKGNIIKFTVAG